MSKHTESSLQQAAVRYFRTQFPQYSKLLIAIPNHAVLSGDASQRARQWKRLEAVEAQGYEYVIIKDIESFISKVKEYM